MGRRKLQEEEQIALDINQKQEGETFGREWQQFSI